MENIVEKETEKSVELDIPKYNTFLRILNLFKDIANDVIVHDGVIRQKTNDKFSVFEIDLKPSLSILMQSRTV